MYPVAVVLQYTIQYNTILCYTIHNKQNNRYTLKTIHKNITNTITQNYKQNTHKITNIKFQPNT